ncbi:MAG: hypothetical protein GY871_13370 [Actinomycetales bacterium]|nr:hypothetical protein [Actinomycetales bacterium]
MSRTTTPEPLLRTGFEADESTVSDLIAPLIVDNASADPRTSQDCLRPRRHPAWDFRIQEPKPRGTDRVDATMYS